MASQFHHVSAWIQRLGEGITVQQAVVSVILALIAMTVVWLGQECSFLHREVRAIRADVRKQAIRTDRLQAKVDDVGWRDSRLLTQFDWRQPPV